MPQIDDDVTNFRHDSILRISKRPFVSSEPSSPSLSANPSPRLPTPGPTPDKKRRKSPSAGTNGTNDGQERNEEREKYTVLRSGELFGTHYAVVCLRDAGVVVTGSAWVSVLYGIASIFGSVLCAEDTPALLVSAPLAPFAVNICPGGSSREEARRYVCGNTLHPEVKVSMQIRDAVEGQFRRSGLKNHCVILLTATSTDGKIWKESDAFQSSADVSHTLESYVSHAGIPALQTGTELVKGLSAIEEKTKMPIFREWLNWQHVTTSIDSYRQASKQQLRLLVCGASGTGKSTFARCVVNHLLRNKQGVVLVDTDLGQPEMNLPGLVAAHFVTDMRLGTAVASNRKTPITARYLGETTAREEPDVYARYVEQVCAVAIAFANRHGYSVVVNSDGWISGVGAALLNRLTDCVQPTHVAMMTFLDQTQKTSLSEVCNRVASDRCFVVESGRHTRDSCFSSGAQRDLQTAAYFSKELELGRVYRVPIGTVQVVHVGDSCELQDQEAVLNGTVVGIAEKGEGEDKEDGWIVRGFGIVRGVDKVRKILYICTPLGLQELQKCTGLLVSGGIQVPHALFMAMAAKAGSSARAPYVLNNIVATGDSMKSRGTLNRRTREVVPFSV